MDGPEHWREADLILTQDPCEYGCPHSGCQHEMRLIARAQAHATLAAAALHAAAESVRLGTLPPVVLAGWQEIGTALPAVEGPQYAEPAGPDDIDRMNATGA